MHKLKKGLVVFGGASGGDGNYYTLNGTVGGQAAGGTGSTQ